MIRAALAATAIFLLASCASTPMAPSAAVADLVPTGKLRAVINLGNPILANKDAAGQPFGVSVDLARELGKRLGVPVDLVTVTSAGASVETLAKGQVDVGFFALDPARAATTAFTAAYIQIEGAYLAESLKRHGIEGAIVASPAGP